jgi:hypothetical protein
MAGGSTFDWISFALGVLVGIAICFLLMRRKRAQVSPAPPLQAIELPSDLKAIVLLYRADGRLIDAVKLVRERTGCDLRTAKYLVEQVR